MHILPASHNVILLKELRWYFCTTLKSLKNMFERPITKDFRWKLTCTNDTRKERLQFCKTSLVAAPQRYSVKKVFYKFCKIHRKKTVQGLFFNKVAALRPATLLKKRHWHKWIPVNFAKFLRAFSYRTSRVAASGSY